MNRSFLKSIIYNTLLNSNKWIKRVPFKENLWHFVTTPGSVIRTKLYKKKILLPTGYSYPSIIRNYPSFNNPYLELCIQTYLKTKKTMNIIDVGAATGDTVIFIKENMPGKSSILLAIEGDGYFFTFLKNNTKHYKEEVVLLNKMLSAEESLIPSLVNNHYSSKTAQGETLTQAYSLDKLIKDMIFPKVDIIKIDVDGFDGRVLAGAKNILKEMRPAVIFEYHPYLLKKTNNSFSEAFEVLLACGYDSLLWFNKFGEFEFSSDTKDNSQLELITKKCITAGELNDMHYDIVALHIYSTLKKEDITSCIYSKKKQTPF